MSAILNKNFGKEFIEKYKNLPVLWQPKNEKYKSRRLRIKAWNELLEKYKEIDENATLETVKKKINNIRTSYRRELKKVLQLEKFGAGANETYCPTLWYFDELKFLRDLELPTSGISTILDPENSDSPDELKKPNIQKISRNIPEKRSMNILLKRAVENLSNLKEQEYRDEADIYADAWATSYRKLSEEQKFYARKAIEEVLVLGQLNKLSLNSVLSISICTRFESASFTPPETNSSAPVFGFP